MHLIYYYYYFVVLCRERGRRGGSSSDSSHSSSLSRSSSASSISSSASSGSADSEHLYRDIGSPAGSKQTVSPRKKGQFCLNTISGFFVCLRTEVFILILFRTMKFYPDFV